VGSEEIHEADAGVGGVGALMGSELRMRSEELASCLGVARVVFAWEDATDDPLMLEFQQACADACPDDASHTRGTVAMDQAEKAHPILKCLREFPFQAGQRLVRRWHPFLEVDREELGPWENCFCCPLAMLAEGAQAHRQRDLVAAGITRFSRHGGSFTWRVGHL